MNKKDLASSEYYLNRELSLLAFNQRVLALALDEQIPLLERLRFLCITSANLDEFFEVRIAGHQEKLASGTSFRGPDGLCSDEVLDRVSEQAHKIVTSLYACFNDAILPALAKQNIRFVAANKWSPALQKWIKHYFKHDVLPLVSPVGLDHAHPFPRLVNKSLNFILSLEGKDAFGRDSGWAIVQAPRSLPRVVKVPDEFVRRGDHFILLSDIIQHYAEDLFPGMHITGSHQFRLTRKSDLFVDHDEIEDLALALKSELSSRRFGNAVRLEIDGSCPQDIAEFLLAKHNLTDRDLYRCDGPVNLHRFAMVIELLDRKDLCYPAVTPRMPKALKKQKDIFAAIRMAPILLHHPYETFRPVVDFIEQATRDPKVLAIKQTLYRTRPNSMMVKALVEAARHGKEVTAVIELRARFDEESNIELANRLQNAGALVVYGVVGYKTHAKMTLVVRREGKKLARYAHLGTGNYHETTVQHYTDFGLLTYDESLTQDVQRVFQQLTGMGKTTKLKKLIHAPFNLYDALDNYIDFEIQQAQKGKKALIMIKVNGMTDPGLIQKLYQASQAGVEIKCIVRGVCRLRPGIPNVSDNIQIYSVLGRYLEHSRVYFFHHGGDEKLFLSSADLMERNLHHRVEVCFPIEDKKLFARIKQEGLKVFLDNHCQHWQLQADGDYYLRQRSNTYDPQAYLIDKHESNR